MAAADRSKMWKIAIAALSLIFLAHGASALTRCKNSCDVHDDVISCHVIVNADISDCLRKHPNAYILDLSYISVDVMTADSLAGLTQIKRLFLDGSSVKLVSPDVFELLPNLRIVSLRGMGPAASKFLPALRHAGHLTHVFLAKNYKECSCDWWKLMSTVVASDMRVVDMEETPHCSVKQIRRCHPLAIAPMPTASMPTASMPTTSIPTIAMRDTQLSNIAMPNLDAPQTTIGPDIITERPPIMALSRNNMSHNPSMMIVLTSLCGLLALTVLVLVVILIFNRFGLGFSCHLKIFKRLFKPGQMKEDIDVERGVANKKVNFSPGVEVREIRNYGPSERVNSLGQDLVTGLKVQRQKTLHYSDDETDEPEQSTEYAGDEHPISDFHDQYLCNSDPEDVTESLLEHEKEEMGENEEVGGEEEVLQEEGLGDEEDVGDAVGEDVGGEVEEIVAVKPRKLSLFNKLRKKH